MLDDGPLPASCSGLSRCPEEGKCLDAVADERPTGQPVVSATLARSVPSFSVGAGDAAGGRAAAETGR